MLDTFFAASQAIITILMAYLGVHVTLHPPSESDRQRRRYQIGFLVCGTLAVALVIVQSIRTSRTQADFASQLERIKLGEEYGADLPSKFPLGYVTFKLKRNNRLEFYKGLSAIHDYDFD